MSSNLSAAQSVKQGTRQFMSVASDKMKLASSAVARGDTRELDVAIIKSTTPQFHVVPKEKHVRTLKDIVHNGTKDHVREVIKELLERLKTATDWLTALKSLMVVHRLMRESNTIFLSALAQHSTNQTANVKGKGLLNMGNFLDTTNIDGRFDYSEWVRGYGKYLDEQLEVYKELSFYPEMEHGGESSRMRTLSGDQLLKQLPVLQRLQQRLMDCKPSGAAARDPVVQAALMAVLKESFKVYKAISEGIINLADRFFEMEYLEAQKGLEIYKESIVDNTRLQEYYREVEQIEELKRAVQFPRLENLPPDFLTQMEGYVKEAPRPFDEIASASKKKSPPLRRGTKAAVGRTPLRFETANSNPSTNSDPGMIGTFSKANELEEPKASAEPNLLDLDELTISEPSPATTGPSSSAQNGFGTHQPSPAGDHDIFAGQLESPYLASNTTDATFGSGPAAPVLQQPQLNSPYQFPSSNAPQLSAGPASNPFGPASTYSGASSAYQPPQSSFQQPANAAHGFSSIPRGPVQPPQQFPSGLPQQSQPASAGYHGGGGAPMVQQAARASQAGQGGYSSQPSSFGGYPSASPAPSVSGGSAYSGNFSRPAYGNYEAQQSGTQPASAGSGNDLFGEFGSGFANSKPSAQSSPPKPATAAPVVAAGLTRPTNVVLAKEAALHDPFAGLANLKPSTTPKYSPPLKNFSTGPASGAGPQSGGLYPGGQQGGGPQPHFSQGYADSGFQGYGNENGLGPSAFGAPASGAPATTQQQQHQPENSSSFAADQGFSLI